MRRKHKWDDGRRWGWAREGMDQQAGGAIGPSAGDTICVLTPAIEHSLQSLRGGAHRRLRRMDRSPQHLATQEHAGLLVGGCSCAQMAIGWRREVWAIDKADWPACGGLA